MIEDLFSVYAQIINSQESTDAAKLRELFDEIKVRSIQEKWILEMCYSFYNLGRQNKTN
jgi:hypothetical protein